uniref:cysteine--tRNA ligase n=2 Tax=Aplanochytrium stocchinoi TaxID=215587 RepID=A0A7S3PD35_9STRA
MGHARCYLSLDILRRIMEDYFNYDVVYQINITDIDDKIILRARQNKLIDDYLNDCAIGIEKVVEDVEKATTRFEEKLEKKEKELEEPLPEDANSRSRQEREDAINQLKLKKENFRNMLLNITAVKAHLEKKNVSEDKCALVTAAREPLAAMLDVEKGHTVTEHAVFDAHTRKYEREYMEDMDALGIRPPDVITRVTEYVPDIIAFIERIIGKGLAYESNGSVYLDIQSFKGKGYNYRKCVPSKGDTSKADIEESEGALAASSTEKKHPNDFALWKNSKPGEPAWESPWGKGRPGWHIECSVVASDILGDNLDMHSGGSDLKFPHHDNELAQSEAALGVKQWVNYFTHAGHLHIKGLKMSKSLKNFVTIRQALEHHSARQLRMMFLLQEWDKPMNFSDQTVEDAKSKEATFKNFFQRVKALMREDYLADPNGVGFRKKEQDHALLELLLQTQDEVHNALLDNFDTRTAVLSMINLVAEANKYLQEVGDKPAVLLIRKIAVYSTQMLKVFGVIQGTDDLGFPLTDGAPGDVETIAKPYLDTFVDFRDKIRNFALSLPKNDPSKTFLLSACDEVRDTSLVEVGVRLEDRVDQSAIWKLDDPAVLKTEVAEKENKIREQKRQKQQKRLEAIEKELSSIKPFLEKLPDEYFSADTYELDDNGIPVKEKNAAEPLAKSKIKSLKKEQAVYKKNYDKVVKKANGDIPEYINALEEELSELTLDQ